MDAVKVLVWGYNDGACAVYRGQMYDEPLAKLGVEMRYVDALHQDIHFTDLDDKPLPSSLGQPEVLKMLHENRARMHVSIDASAVEWADVVLFRRYYNTHFRCALPECDYRTFSAKEMGAHPHPVKMRDEQPGVPARDDITSLIWRAAEKSTNKGIIYDSDDLLIGPALSRWNGFWPDVMIQQTRINRMVKRADLVTVATPTLARYFSTLNPNTRVVRNSVNPALYTATETRPESRPRVFYYGQAARMRDYAGYPDDVTGKWQGGYARLAVEDHRRQLHSIFLGAKPGEETRIISRYFDEVRPYSEIAQFPQALANAFPDVGLAPLGGDRFDQGKSELHWLEYSLVGAATLAYRYNGDGPYNMIRDGVDGVLARGRAEWSDGLKRLLDPHYREDIAAAARERVLREYDWRERASEWADAFKWAAEHPGYHAAA